MSETDLRDHREGPVWTYRGYELEAPQLTTALVHLYRGEVQRANVWRNRLDTTTNWSVVTTAAALTFAFGSPQNPHFILLLVYLLLLVFLSIEARRYRYYELWYRRAHLLETNFFAAMVSPPFSPAPDWGQQLENSLRNPRLRLTWWEAVGHRTRRNYLWMVSILLASWVIKLNVHPTVATDLHTLVPRASVGNLIPGVWIVGAVLGTYLALALLTLVTILSPEQKHIPSDKRSGAPRIGPRAPRPAQALATIITCCGTKVANKLMQELGRGVTQLEGTGMYTGESRDVLLCAVTNAQIPALNRVVAEVDSDAFVVVNSLAQVRGGGFSPFPAP